MRRSLKVLSTATQALTATAALACAGAALWMSSQGVPRPLSPFLLSALGLSDAVALCVWDPRAGGSWVDGWRI